MNRLFHRRFFVLDVVKFFLVVVSVFVGVVLGANHAFAVPGAEVENVTVAVANSVTRVILKIVISFRNQRNCFLVLRLVEYNRNLGICQTILHVVAPISGFAAAMRCGSQCQNRERVSKRGGGGELIAEC